MGVGVDVCVCVCACEHVYTYRFDADQALNTVLGAVAGLVVGAATQYLRDKVLLDAAPYVSIAYDDESEF